MKKCYLPKISTTYVPDILLLGNGVCRCFESVSWNQLLTNISVRDFSEKERDALKSIPYPLQAVVCSHDKMDSAINKVVDLFMPEKTAALKDAEERNKLIRKFSDLSFDAILTTNYSYEIEQALRPDFTCKKGKANRYRKQSIVGTAKEKQFGLFRGEGG